jgi:hypothetical protein
MFPCWLSLEHFGALVPVIPPVASWSGWCGQFWEGGKPFQNCCLHPTQHWSLTSVHICLAVFLMWKSQPHAFLFIQKDTENNMRNINPFYLQEALDGIAGKVKNLLCLKNGTLLVQGGSWQTSGGSVGSRPLWILSYPSRETTPIHFMACWMKRYSPTCLIGLCPKPVD